MDITFDVAEKIQSLREQIGYLKDAEIIQDTRGHSGVLCLVVQDFKQKFFTKVYPGDVGVQLQKVQDVYNKLKIPTAQIKKLDYLADTNETICSYEYLDGPTLGELLPKISTTECEDLGYKVGVEISKFAKIKGDLKEFQQKFDEEAARLWQNVYQKKRQYNQTYNQKLPVINLKRLQKSFENLRQSIYATKPVFVHNDINLNNVIFVGDQSYFVDTSDGDIKFRALDFRGNCWWGWAGNNVEKERAVYRGIYRGLFCDKIPENFHKELAFTMIYEFILRVYKYRDDMEQIRYSFLRWHDILVRTNYFEKYRFDWF